MKSLEEIIDGIQSREDLDRAMNTARLAAQTAKRKRLRVHLLADKLRCIQAEKHHRDILRGLRVRQFDIEDSLAA
jgi:hypothetical protein